MSRPLRRIDNALAAMRTFIDKVFGQRDRCSITSFNDDVKILLMNETEEPCLHKCLQSLVRQCDGNTALYDAICFSVAQFVITANGSRPWMLIILTDGDNNSSKHSIDDAKHHLAQFNKPQDNVTMVIGLSEGVNQTKMRNLCSTGSFYMPARSSDMLHVIFAFLALKISTGTRLNLEDLQMEHMLAAVAQSQRTTHIERKPVDLLIVVDISGSMNNT
jgi:Mg-chelatase subunit ChlD